MATERIFCGVCGYATKTALFEHLREAHGLTPEAYKEKCPNAPLFTASFKQYVEGQGLHLDPGASPDSDGEMRVTRELFGVALSCAMKPADGVPAVDPAYHFDGEQATVHD